MNRNDNVGSGNYTHNYVWGSHTLK